MEVRVHGDVVGGRLVVTNYRNDSYLCPFNALQNIKKLSEVERRQQHINL